MKSTPQLNLHPDAESLNAFAEQALAAEEREQVLAHLAGCNRCRQVIFLAQQAAADAEALARVPAARPATQPVSWFWNWRIAWVPAAALVATLALVVTYHPWRATQMPELAKVVPPGQAVAPTPTPQEQAIAGTAHKPVLVVNSLAGKAEYPARRRTPEELTAPSAAPPVESDASAASIGTSNAFLPPSMESARQPETKAQYQPEPAVAAWQQEQQQMVGSLSASADASRQISQKSMRAEEYPSHTSRKAAKSGPRMAQQSQSMLAGSFDSGTQQQFAGLATVRKVNPSNLPSGLAAVSMASAQQLTLEIDQAGALFLSRDYGQHWEPVAQQWTGRAIEVRTNTGLSGSTAPANGFELKNEAGSTWASADGKTWTVQ